jgi:hypothetical protein
MASKSLIFKLDDVWAHGREFKLVKAGGALRSSRKHFGCA